MKLHITNEDIGIALKRTTGKTYSVPDDSIAFDMRESAMLFVERFEQDMESVPQ